MAATSAYVALRDATTASHASIGRSLPRWLAPGLCAAALLEAAGIGMIGVRLWQPGPSTYRTLGQDAEPIGAGTIRVVPDPAMALTDWNALLHVLQLRVVGGPDRSGAYLVVPVSPSANSQHALQQLRAIHGNRLAEPISPNL